MNLIAEVDQRYRRAFDQANNQVEELQRQLRELQNSRGPDRARREVEDLADQTKKAGGAFGKLSSAASSFGRTFRKVAEVSGAMAILDSVTGTINNIGSAIGDQQEAFNQYAASTGTSIKDMQAIKKEARGLYNQNLGEDWNDLGDALASTRQILHLTGGDLQNATKNALIFRDVFKDDIPEVNKTVDTLQKNFKGLSNQSAFNFLAQGKQLGLDKSGELLDSANEYSLYFSKLGFSAQNMFNVFKAGIDAGAFNLDKVGDAIKEFGIRSKDGSKTTIEAYQLLGLNATQMQKKFAAGGSVAQTAYRQVAAAINKVQDPVKRNTAMLNLFGTQAEDVESGVILAMTNARKQFDATKNTMKEIQDVKYSSISYAFRSIGRQLLTEFVYPLSDLALPALTKFGKGLETAIPKIKSYFKRGLQAMQPFIKALQTVGDLFANSMAGTGDMSAATGISNFLISLGVGEDKAYKFSGALSDVFDKLAAVKNIVKGAGSLLTNALMGNGDISGVQDINKGLQSIGFSPDQAIKISNGVVDTFDRVRGKLDDFVKSMKPVLDDMMGYLKEAFSFDGSLDFGSIIDNVSELQKSVNPILDSMLSGIAPALRSVTSLLTPLMKMGKQAFSTIIPLVLKLASSLYSKLAPVFTSVFGYITKTLLPQVSSVLAAWLPKIGALFSKVGGLIMAIYNTGIAPVINSLVTIFKWAWPVITTVVTSAINILKPIIGGIIDVLGGVIDFLTGVFTGDWDLAWKGIKEVAVGIWDGITGAVKEAFNSVIGIINAAIQKISSFSFDLPEWAGGGTVGSLGIPEIPMLAKGGFTTGPSIAGEAGTEAVIPLNNKQRSMNLLEKTNRMMGYTTNNNGGDSIVLQFDITIQGNADKEVVQQAVQAAQPTFRQQYQAMKRQNARTSL
ncbi:phage tail tape measure protein [Paenibacillus farraposensis]|nr:phage tail tape measure protein [Paenibacillus farraposensis]